MKRCLDFVMAPFALFVGLIALWGGTILLFGAAAFIARILRAFGRWLSDSFPGLLAETLSDPWKVASLPVALGVVIFVGWLIWDDINSKSQNQVLRGRKLGSSRSQRRAGATFDDHWQALQGQAANRKRWTPSSRRKP